MNADDLGYLGANDDLQAFNLYSYCSNNPIIFVDSSGNFVIIATAATTYALYFLAVTLVALILCDPVVQESINEMANDVQETIDAIAENINDSHPDEYTVYSLLDPETGEVRYVGRTKNYEKRMKQHEKEGSKIADLVPGPIIKHLNYSQARGIEQIGIISYNTIELGKNSINGVGPNNRNRDVYGRVAYDYLYNQFSNEWYNLFGW